MEETKVVTSKRFSLDKFDWLKAALMAAGTPIVEYLVESLNAGGFTGIDWKHAIAIGLSAGLLYILKNFLSTSTTTVKQ